VADARHCPRCFLPLRLCLCPLIPRLRPRIRVLVLRHWFESHRLSNTGRLVQLALAGSDLLDHGRPGYRLLAEDLPSGPGCCLLFPDSEGGAPMWQDGPPELLVVVDGSWSQARSMVRRLPGLAGMPRLSLGAVPAPARRIRRSPRAGLCSTIEAVAGALELWEEPCIARQLRQLYDLLAARLDETRGDPEP